MTSEENMTTKVLIAHRNEDSETAINLKKQLKLYGSGDKLVFEFLEGKDKKLGWEYNLPKKIEKTNLLTFFLPNSDINRDEWEWVIWAAGVAYRFSPENNFPIILLHCKGLTPPRPFRSDLKIERYSAEIEKLIAFLKFFYGTAEFTADNSPINITLAKDQDELEVLAKKIQKNFSEPTMDFTPCLIDEQNLLPFINFVIDNNVEFNSDKLPDLIPIESNSQAFELLFSLLFKGRSWNWGDIIISQKESRGDWTSEVEKAIIKIHKGKIADPIKSRLRSKSGRIFSPILQSVENWSDGKRRFKVIFAEEVSEPWVANAPKIDLATLLTNLNLAARLQWEVCDHFLRVISEDKIEGNDKQFFISIMESYKNLEKDAEIRRLGEAPGQRNQDRMRDSFDSIEEREEIEINLNEQEKYKKILLSADSSKFTIEDIKDALIKLKKLNGIVIRKAAQRFSELIDNEYSE